MNIFKFASEINKRVDRVNNMLIPSIEYKGDRFIGVKGLTMLAIHRGLDCELILDNGRTKRANAYAINEILFPIDLTADLKLLRTYYSVFSDARYSLRNELQAKLPQSLYNFAKLAINSYISVDSDIKEYLESEEGIKYFNYMSDGCMIFDSFGKYTEYVRTQIRNHYQTTQLLTNLAANKTLNIRGKQNKVKSITINEFRHNNGDFSIYGYTECCANHRDIHIVKSLSEMVALIEELNPNILISEVDDTDLIDLFVEYNTKFGEMINIF